MSNLQTFKNRSGFRELRAEIFQQTIKFVQQGGYFADGTFVEISNENVIKNSVFYDREFHLENNVNNFNTKFSVVNRDCLEVAESLVKEGFNPICHNFASGRNPGGGVLGGTGAQEENLFRRTNLFLSLYQYASYAEEYGITKNVKQYPLDWDFGGIYSEGITVFRGSEANGYCLLKDPYKLAFVTVAAISHPELEMRNKELYIAKRDIERTKNKIRTVLRIAGKHAHDALITGAFECGAFGNPPKHIAMLFKEVFAEKEFNCFKKVVFAIIDDHNASHKSHNPHGNYLPFKEVFS
jgi:uncharacterized protein (TIGR02452 family)